MTRRTSNENSALPLEEQIRNIRFGIEIESYGLTVPAAACVLQTVIGGNIDRDHDYIYNRHWCTDAQGRKWTIVRDGSVEGGFEFVSPICTLAQGDEETIQNIIRAFRRAGARPTDGTGMHIHVDATENGTGLDTPQAISRFAKMFYAREELFAKAFEASSRLSGDWCRAMEERFAEALRQRGTDSSRERLSLAWYNGSARYAHYDRSRYRGVNLHSVFTRGTAECRYFPSPIRHAGKFRAQLLFVLAVAAKARNGRHSSSKKVTIAHNNEKYAMRSYMLKLGMSGPYFKTAREHLLSPLQGCASRARPAA